MSGTHSLERNYRWLLACYPARHRQAHGEEMLGVLLSAARDGQRRPSPREAANLVWGALLIWLRPGRGEAADAGWRDTLAVFSLAAPVIVMCVAVGALLASSPRPLETHWPSGHFGRSVDWRAIIIELLFYGLGLVLPFVLTGLRTAATIACGVALVFLAWAYGTVVYTVIEYRVDFGLGWSAAALVFPLFAYAIEMAALLGSPGPRRGRQLLFTRRGLPVALAAVVAGVLAWSANSYRITPPNGEFFRDLGLAYPVLAWASGVALAVIVCWSAFRSAAGRRLVLLFAIPACPWLVGTFWPAPQGPVALAVAVAPALVLTGVLLGVARRGRRAPSGGPASA
jgi:hypothetical protein